MITFLCFRHEDRIVWMQILEVGNNYVYYGAKGMELQETSCHSLEATRLDDIMDAAFEKEGGAFSCLNSFPLHTATPLTRVTALVHSDARNALTGVIEAKETLRLVSRTYLKTLIWFLARHIARRARKKAAGSSRVATAVADAEQGSPPPGEDGDEDEVGVVIPFTHEEEDDANSIFPGRSSSIDAVELDDWPSTTSDGEDSPSRQERARIKVTQWADSVGRAEAERGSAYVRKELGRGNSLGDDALSEIGGGVAPEAPADEVHPFTVRGRNKLLPPISMHRSNSSSSNLARSDSLDSLTKKLDNIFLSGEEATPQVSASVTPSRTLVKRDTIIANTPRRRRPSSALLDKIGEHANALLPKDLWLRMPEDTKGESSRMMTALEGNFPDSWFQFVLRRSWKKYLVVVKSDADLNLEEETERLTREEFILEAYRKVVRDCFSAVYGGGGANADFDRMVESQGPGLPVKAFRGDLPRGRRADWLEGEAPELLFKVVLPAFRSALKLSLDEVLLGADLERHEELQGELEELEADWHLGPDDGAAWGRAVAAGRPRSLFSVSAADSVSATAGEGGGGAGLGRTLFRSRLVRLRPCTVSVARLSGEAARALWASLSLELLYLTNDDDERYSIQAEERILRNLTVQAADPPLGYAVLSSEPMRKGIDVL